MHLTWVRVELLRFIILCVCVNVVVGILSTNQELTLWGSKHYIWNSLSLPHLSRGNREFRFWLVRCTSAQNRSPVCLSTILSEQYEEGIAVVKIRCRPVLSNMTNWHHVSIPLKPYFKHCTLTCRCNVCSLCTVGFSRGHHNSAPSTTSSQCACGQWGEKGRRACRWTQRCCVWG